MSEVFPRCCFCGRYIGTKVDLDIYQLKTQEYGTLEVTVCQDCAREKLGDE